MADLSDPTVIAAAAVALVAGAAFGWVVDHLAARWAQQIPGDETGGRWRGVLVAATGAVVAAGLVLRWGTAFESLAVPGGVAAILLALLAADLYRRLLPNVLTYPLIVIAAAALVAGINPLVPAGTPGIVSAVAAAIGAPAFLLVTNLIVRGGLGFGDVKLAVGVGLLAGVVRFVLGFAVASVAFSLLLLALMAARRVGRRTFVPFGPVLIYAAVVAMLAP